MRKIVTLSSALLVVFAATIANALTFKSDGSIVQNSGEVVLESYSERFSKQFIQSGINWPLSKGAGLNTPGFVGDKLFLPGTPLLAIRNIKRGDDYVDALMKTNGFPDKNALQRYFVANANPTFLERLGLTETQAIAFISNVKTTGRNGLDAETVALLGAQYAFAEQALDDTITRLIQEKAEASVEEEISEQISDAVDTEVEAAVEQTIEEALNNWWDEYIQELIDGGATILEQTDNSVTYTYD